MEKLPDGYRIEDGWLNIDGNAVYGPFVTEVSMQLEDQTTVYCFSGAGFQKLDIDQIPEPAKTYLIKLYEESLDQTGRATQ